MAVAGAEGERQNRADARAVEGHVEERADAEERAEGEGVEGDLNVVGGDLRRHDLILLVGLVPPARLPLQNPLARLGRHPGQLRELRVVPRPQKAEHGEEQADREGERRVAPGASEGAREVAREEVADAAATLGGVGAVDAPVRAYGEAVEVVHQPRVAALGAGDGEV